jgi:mannose-6-phosphate isomerase-like protein (cupin superfamily)
MNTKNETTSAALGGAIMKNTETLKWEKMLPDLGKDSPVYAVLRADAKTNETTIVIEFPAAMHIPRHTHEKSETHFILRGSHLFENSDTGERFDIKENGYFYLPGLIAHEAWVPAGSKAVITLEDGWKVNWLDGAPTAKDLGKGSPDA